MDKQANFYIIGGQYAACCYGTAVTLHQAKLLASKCIEYWDNWQGWHKPAIYRAEDVRPINNFYGAGYAPQPHAVPAAHWSNELNKWITREG